MKYEIRFTLGDSNIWHSIYTDFDIFNEVQTGQVVANIITSEIHKIQKESLKAKKVIIIDEEGKTIAKSSDICNVESLTFNNNKDL